MAFIGYTNRVVISSAECKSLNIIIIGYWIWHLFISASTPHARKNSSTSTSDGTVDSLTENEDSIGSSSGTISHNKHTAVSSGGKYYGTLPVSHLAGCHNLRNNTNPFQIAFLILFLWPNKPCQFYDQDLVVFCAVPVKVTTSTNAI